MFSLLIYRITLFCFLPLVLILLLVRSRGDRAYRLRLLERLGFFPKQITSDKPSFKSIAQGGILVHAASVGEVIALKGFIEALLTTFPSVPITITTFTPTGSAQVKSLFSNRVQHSYLSLDIFPCTGLFLHRLQPKLVIFMETELWPNLVAQCANKKIKLLLINGRLSQKSLKSYKKIKPLITPCLNRFDKILSQSQENLTHFTALGAQAARCSNIGNLKFDVTHNTTKQSKLTELQSLLKSQGTVKRKIWLIASTHEGDETIALRAFSTLLKDFPQLLLVLVPRHPERFDLVAQLCKQQGFSLARRSEKTPVIEQNIWLLDSLGELMAGFALSDIVTMGGSFSGIGGHNPLEPALFKKPIIVGSDMSNFTEILQQLLQEHGLIQLDKDQPTEQLVHQIAALLLNPQQQAYLGQQAYEVVMANQGASQKTLLEVKALLPFTSDVTTNVTTNETKNSISAVAKHVKNYATKYISANGSQHHCLYNNQLIADFTPEMLDADYWQAKKAITGTAQGRGTTWFIRYCHHDDLNKSDISQQHDWVLRHYYRGGMIGKLIKDSYFMTGVQKSRAMREFTLLEQMQYWQLPAPKPVACRITRYGLFGLRYRADLLSSRIKDAQDLVAILSKEQLSDDLWRKVGETIKRFHDQGIYHHDLNAHNILINQQQQVYLIDFDQGELRYSAQDSKQKHWKVGNISRLKRSFLKESRQLTVFHFTESNWQLLRTGYDHNG